MNESAFRTLPLYLGGEYLSDTHCIEGWIGHKTSLNVFPIEVLFLCFLTPMCPTAHYVGQYDALC